jgi:asparagine synthase (glutamine-hydrolysing)
MICNGEIYNFKSLIDKYSLKCKSSSDCEVIIHMYEKIGFYETVKALDGVFAIVLIDKNTGDVHCARDIIGVRSMYIYNEDDTIVVASELKAFVKLGLDNTKITQFKPGGIWNSVNGYLEYFNVKTYQDNLKSTNFKIVRSNDDQKTEIKNNIVNLLTNSIRKRLVSDRPIGCLLSGGLDSSLVAAILCKLINENDVNAPKLKTFSVGLSGSPDLKYARDVADYIGSDHHELVLTESEMLAGLEPTIFQLETYDTTTIRAGTPMYLLSKYIKENFDTTVIFSGEGSDELSGSYLYFHNAPSPKDFQSEIYRLVDDLHYFDVLRCDKSIAGSGLEVRVPFLDKDFLSYYISIDAVDKMPQIHADKPIEKYLLRSAFDNGLLPDAVLWRQKEGMSDGVSSEKNSWGSIIKNHTSTMEFNQTSQNYEFNKPMLLESLYYRNIFTKYFPNCEKTIPYYWLPKWSGNIIDPSARVLDVY